MRFILISHTVLYEKILSCGTVLLPLLPLLLLHHHHHHHHYIAVYGTEPLVDSSQSRISRSLFSGDPWFLLPLACSHLLSVLLHALTNVLTL